MNNKHLFLSPELLSRLTFSQPTSGLYYVQAVASIKPMRALPEEIIRQLVILSLIHQYHYEEFRIRVEFPIQMGRTKKRADVVVLGESGTIEVVVEVKQRIDSEAVEQLKSYVIVTGANFALAVSGLEYLCLKREDGNRFIEMADIPFNGQAGVPSHTLSSVIPKSSPAAALRASLQLEKFERVDQSHIRLTIQGRSLNLSILDLASYKRIQKRFLAAGVVLIADVSQSAWLAFIRELLAQAPSPESLSSSEDRWADRIGRWIRALPVERRFVRTAEIFSEALGLPGNEMDRSGAIRIAAIMRSLGWRRTCAWINGRTARVYRRGKAQQDMDPLVAPV